MSDEKGISMGSERRIHERMYFSRSEELIVSLRFPGDNNKTVVAKIINLSVGGMAISFRRAHDSAITQGEILYIKDINGADELKCIENKMVEAIWVLDNEVLETIGVGCEFHGFNEENTTCIKQFIERLATGKTG